jgi:hypothetical protein
LGQIPDGTTESRVKIWWAALTQRILEAESSNLIEANELYIGNYWSLVHKLISEAETQGFDTDLWIMSAGYGLITGTDLIVPYSATFTRGEDDSVVGNPAEANSGEIWWNQLTKLRLSDSDNPRSLKELVSNYPKDYFLMVASNEYLSAVQSDLISGMALLNKEGELVLISSKKNQITEELRPFYIPTDARLLCSPDCATGCDLHLLGRNVRGSIGISLARVLLGKAGTNGGFSATNFKKEVIDAVEKSPVLFTHRRTPMSDIEVKSYIHRELNESQSLSATRLLRKFRDQGNACEQKRFREIYLEVKKEHR